MKSRLTSFALSLALVSIIFTSCKKTDEKPDNPQNNNSTFNYADAFGILVAVKSVSYTSVGGFDVPIELNTGSAFFPTDAGASTFADAGTVKLENKELTKMSNNIYLYDNYLSPLTLSSIEWSVAGNGSIPAFTKTVDRPLPTFSGYSSLPATVSKATGITISLGSAVSAADSVIVIITSSNEQVSKSVVGSSASVTFSSTDLSKLNASSTGSVSVSPYNLSSATISARKYYFVNESTYLKMAVNITN